MDSYLSLQITCIKHFTHLDAFVSFFFLNKSAFELSAKAPLVKPYHVLILQ